MSRSQQDDIYWNYDNPNDWLKDFPCANGLCQSPIDINTTDTFPEFYPRFEFSPNYFHNQLITVANNGQQITGTLKHQIDENDCWFRGGGLTGRFHFVNFHLHWGRNNRHGSDHELNGYRYPAEAHFVHKNYRTNLTAVLAYFLNVSDENIGHDEPNQWDKFVQISSQLISKHDQITSQFNFNHLMRIDSRSFYRYMGSLTSPPCTEGIIWTIFTDEIMIKDDSLNLLRQNIMRKAYRPVQPINGRTVFRNCQYSEMI